jgi:hypothetical protein
MIQEEEQNHKSSRILPKHIDQVITNGGRSSKKYRKKEQKFKIQNPKQTRQEHQPMEVCRRRRWMRRRCNTRDAALKRAVCGQHAPASEIHSQARVTHALARGCQMVVVQTTDESGDPQEQGEGCVGGDGFLKFVDLILKKIKTKNFRKRAMRAVVDAVE